MSKIDDAIKWAKDIAMDRLKPFSLILLGLYEPDKELLEHQVFRRAAAALPEDLASQALKLEKLFAVNFQSEDSSNAFLIEYTRLFLSPGTPVAKQYLTCWKEELGERILEEYLNYLQEKGFEIEKDTQDLPENIATVLEIYDLLTDDEKGAYFQKFLEGFVVKWASRLENEASLPFYKELGRFIQIWAKKEERKYG